MSNPFISDQPDDRATTEHEGRDAIRRLSELGISDDMIIRAAGRADADALMCTALDPANLEGIIRWGRFVRYLREELVPLGWISDNSRNFCRVISPDESFAIVVSSGDEQTGIPGVTPSTKYAKGVTTVEAVAGNSPQAALFDMTLDGEMVEVSEDDEFEVVAPVTTDAGAEDVTAGIPVWYLLFRMDIDKIIVEVSFPNDTDLDESTSARNVWITSWVERILLPDIDRGDVVQDLPEEDNGDEFEVAVSPR